MKIEELIKDKNIKLTTARVKLLEILKEADRPLCYEDIKKDISMDKATFYRNISIESRFIHRDIFFDIFIT